MYHFSHHRHDIEQGGSRCAAAAQGKRLERCHRVRRAETEKGQAECRGMVDIVAHTCYFLIIRTLLNAKFDSAKVI